MLSTRSLNLLHVKRRLRSEYTMYSLSGVTSAQCSNQSPRVLFDNAKLIISCFFTTEDTEFHRVLIGVIVIQSSVRLCVLCGEFLKSNRGIYYGQNLGCLSLESVYVMRHDRIIVDAVASFDYMVLLSVCHFYSTFHNEDEFFAFVR